MRKQAYYLPNLNQLLLQNRQFNRHREKIKLSKSQYQNTTCPTQKNKKQINNMQIQITKLKQLETIPNINTTIDINNLYPITQKQSKFEPSPYQRRKLTQQQRENNRLCKAMELSNPAIDRYNKKQLSNYSAIKERIKYYTNDAGKVLYKFKKSLLQIEKRRRKNEENISSDRSKIIKQNAKQRLQTLLRQSSQLNQIQKTSATLPNDIFYNDGQSIRLPSCSSSLEIKADIHKKYTVNQTKPNREFYRHLTSFSNKNTIENYRKQERELIQSKNIGKKVIHSSLNPQLRSQLKDKRKNHIKDLEIVQIILTTNQ